MKTKKRMPSPNSVMSGLRKSFLGIMTLLLFSNTQVNAQCSTLPGTVTLPLGTVNWNVGTSRVKSVIVPNGCTLNITAPQNMSPGITITINIGGTVNLNSGGVLQACNVSWGGIIVNGNAAAAQAGTNQGRININGTGTIKHANLAVDVDGGGVIITNGGFFIDNKEAVSMDPYSIATPPSVTNNASKFYNTKFEWTVMFPGTSTFTRHVNLKQVYNIHFGGCIFDNTFTGNQNPSIRGIGIESMEASIFCHRLTPATVNGCKAYIGPRTTFTNLLTAIDARSNVTNTPSRSSRIWQCDFINNDHDIFLDKEPSFRIDQNNFTYYEPNALFSPGQTTFIEINQLQTGVYPTTGISYNIYNNTFNTFNSVMTEFMRVNNTHSGLRVYKNTFTNSLPVNIANIFGVVAFGTNTGMNLTCNNFSGFYTTVLQLSGNSPASFGSSTLAAGNVFPGCANAISHITNFGTASTYFFGTGAGQNPSGCVSGTLTLTALTLPGQQNTCPDDLCTVPPRYAANETPLPLNIAVYPNPASQNITFSANEDVVYRSVTVFDVSGKIVLEKAPDSEQTLIVDISALQKGIYFYEIITIDDERVTGKFIKQ